MAEGMVRVQVNPDAVGVYQVAVIIAAADKMRDKPKIAKATRLPVEVPAAFAEALKKEKAVDKDGKEVPAVIDAPPPEAAPAGDMSAADLEKAGKKK
jgi:hypothetical protein